VLAGLIGVAAYLRTIAEMVFSEQSCPQMRIGQIFA
jgi:hypothetical protein